MESPMARSSMESVGASWTSAASGQSGVAQWPVDGGLWPAPEAKEPWADVQDWPQGWPVVSSDPVSAWPSIDVAWPSDAVEKSTSPVDRQVQAAQCAWPQWVAPPHDGAERSGGRPSWPTERPDRLAQVRSKPKGKESAFQSPQPAVPDQPWPTAFPAVASNSAKPQDRPLRTAVPSPWSDVTKPRPPHTAKVQADRPESPGQLTHDLWAQVPVRGPRPSKPVNPWSQPETRPRKPLAKVDQLLLQDLWPSTEPDRSPAGPMRQGKSWFDAR